MAGMVPDCPHCEAERKAELRAAELVFSALGEATMCWADIAKAGVFDSEHCAEIGRRLLIDLGFVVPPGYQERKVEHA